MNAPARQGWADIRTEVLRRIHARDWRPGETIPTEADLAEEFGCARATVNRALRKLAEEGWLDRRRRAGTRVALRPVRKASFAIPVLREDVERRGQVYGYALLRRATERAPGAVCGRMGLAPGVRLLHVTALHLADGAPQVFEDRWINPVAVPSVATAPMDRISANEWLLTHAPYTRGDISFSADLATGEAAEMLAVAPGAPVFVSERTTWNGERPVTAVRQVFAPGYRLHTSL